MPANNIKTSTIFFIVSPPLPLNKKTEPSFVGQLGYYVTRDPVVLKLWLSITAIK
jgi:hypothetical protein